MINIDHLCPGCMQSNPTPDSPCPHCGYSKDTQPLKNALPVFSILEGKYLIGRALGKGGFGITYLSMHLPTETIVAIKEYFPSTLACRASDNETVLPGMENQKLYFHTGMRSYAKEGEILQRLSGTSGIVQFREMLFCNNTAYIVMEYVPGLSLKKYMKQQKTPFTESAALTLMWPILMALQSMHQKGLIHRDVSPENLMYRPDHTLTLIDFGAAREFSDDDDENLTVILKRGYAPEEQYHSDSRQGPWTDVYAVCAVLYHMLTGILPQDATSRIENDQLIPISRIPDLSVRPNVCRAIEKGLQVDALERYASIKALMKDLYAEPLKTVPAKKNIPEDKKPLHTPPDTSDIAKSFAKMDENENEKQPQETNSNTIFNNILILSVFGFVLLFLISFVLDKVQEYSAKTASSDSFTDDYSFSSNVKQVSEEDAAVELIYWKDGNARYAYYATLSDAISTVSPQEAGKSGYTMTDIYFLKDISENIVIPEDTHIALHFDNNTLTNTTSEHTIMNYGSLSLSSGTVDNTSPYHAALYNQGSGTTFLTEMNLKRSAEDGVYNQDSDDRISYYTIDNDGQLILSNSSITNSGSFYSTIHNGCQSDDCSGFHEISVRDDSTITGGCYAILNESNGSIEIENSSLSESYNGIIYNCGALTITNSSFSDSPCAIISDGGNYDYGTDVTFHTDTIIQSD